MVRRKAAVAGQRKVGQRRKEKRKLRTDWGRKIPAPANLIAKPVIPKSKHHSYFEFAENTDKKKKIEFLVSAISHFVVMGHSSQVSGYR